MNRKTMKIKNLLRKIHLYLAIPIGLIISTLCLTGAAMVFDEEIYRIFHPSYFSVKATEENPNLLSFEELAPLVTAQLPKDKKLRQIVVSNSSTESYRVGIEGSRATYYVNQYTGQVLGHRDRFAKGSFYRTMFYTHRWLMDNFKRGEFSWGRTITGVSTLLLVFILITGIFIWLPPTMRKFYKSIRINLHRGWRRFWYDLHVAGGVYVSIVLLVLALTGLMWSFQWYRQGVYAIFNVKNDFTHSRRGGEKKEAPKTVYTNWERAFDQVKEQYPDYHALGVSNGTVTISWNKFGNSRAFDQVKFNPLNGDLGEYIPYNKQSEARQFMGVMYSIHTGSWGGFWSKLLTFIVALLGGTLPLTGYYLWIKKKLQKRQNKKKMNRRNMAK